MKIIIEAEPKEIATLAVAIQERQSPANQQPRDKYGWRRFELCFNEGSPEQQELYALLDRHVLSRRELALLTLGLRVRPEFSLQDFGT